MGTLRTRHRRPGRPRQPERREGRRRPRRVRAVLHAGRRSRSSGPDSRRPPSGGTWACTSIGATFLLELARLPQTPLELAEGLEQLRVARARIPNRHRRDDGRHHRRGHAGRSGARAAAGAKPARVHESGAHGADRATATREIHLRDRRRGLLPRQGPGRRLDRLPARRSRLQGRPPEVRSVHQRRPGHDEPVPARRGLRHRRRRRDGPRPRALRALHEHGGHAQQQLDDRQDLPLGHPEGAARRLPRAARSRSFRTSRTRSRTAFGRPPKTWTCCSSRSAARSATSRACRSSRPFASSGRTSGRENTLYIHLTLVPYIASAGELKTKPTQHSVRDLRSIGIQPDVLLCRTDRPLDAGHEAEDRALLRRRRGSRHHGARRLEHLRGAAQPRRARASTASCSSACTCPQTEAQHGRLARTSSSAIQNPKDEITIHFVGKYVEYEDSYKSINEALFHGGFRHRLKVKLKYVEAEALEQPDGLRAARRRGRHPGRRRGSATAAAAA